MTKGRKPRPRCGCFAPGRTPFEQWINTRRGFDISISRFAVDEMAIVKQAIEAMCTLRTLRCARLVQRPSVRKATDNGSALGPPASRLRSIHDKVLMPCLRFLSRDHVTVAGVDNLHLVAVRYVNSSSKSNAPSGPKPWNMETSRIARGPNRMPTR